MASIKAVRLWASRNHTTPRFHRIRGQRVERTGRGGGAARHATVLGDLALLGRRRGGHGLELDFCHWLVVCLQFQTSHKRDLQGEPQNPESARKSGGIEPGLSILRLVVCLQSRCRLLPRIRGEALSRSNILFYLVESADYRELHTNWVPPRARQRAPTRRADPSKPDGNAEPVEMPFMMMTNTLLGLIVSPTFVPSSSQVPTRTPVVQALDPFLNPVFANPDVMSAIPAVAHTQYGALATGLLVITAY